MLASALCDAHAFSASDVQDLLADDHPELLQRFLQRANEQRRQDRRSREPDPSNPDVDLTLEQLFPPKSDNKRKREETEEEERVANLLGRDEGLPLIDNGVVVQYLPSSPAYEPTSPQYSPTSPQYSPGGGNDEAEEEGEEKGEIKNRCIECGVDMGACNGRQLCGKTKCDAIW